MSGPIEDPDAWLRLLSQNIDDSIAKAKSAMTEAPAQFVEHGAGQDLAMFLESFPTDMSFPSRSHWLLNHVRDNPELQQQFNILNSFHRAILSALDMFSDYIDYAINSLSRSTKETDTKQLVDELIETTRALMEVCDTAKRLPTDVHDPSTVDEFVMEYEDRRRELKLKLG